MSLTPYDGAMTWGLRVVALLALMTGCGGENLPMGSTGETGGSHTGGAVSGGADTGGSSGTGGTVATGGVTGGTVATGGATGGEASGGIATGGMVSGGADTGGVQTGGLPTGGVVTGGTGGTGGTGDAGIAGAVSEAGQGGEAVDVPEPGGASTGGELATGGTTGGTEPTGGTPTGGVATGGSSTGGEATGGASTGGTPPIGAGRWVLDGTCVRLEASECSVSNEERCGGCWNLEPGPCYGNTSTPDHENHYCDSGCIECPDTSLNCDGLDSNGCEAGGDGDTCEEILSPGHEACAWGYFGIDHFGEPCGDTCYACVPICQD